MRYFWVLFSAYIWLLSISPCCGGEACGNATKSVSTHASGNASFSAAHSEGQHHDDICSPFCSCTCCGSHAFYVQPSHIMETAVVEQTIYKTPTYTFQFVSKFEPSIWQPPQLG